MVSNKDLLSFKGNDNIVCDGFVCGRFFYEHPLEKHFSSREFAAIDLCTNLII